MQTDLVNELFVTLAQHYEAAPSEFVTLPKQTVDSVQARHSVSELRNDGFVEEKVRGVVRLTQRGYQFFKAVPRRTA